jgi:hypothetical protein
VTGNAGRTYKKHGRDRWIPFNVFVGVVCFFLCLANKGKLIKGEENYECKRNGNCHR